MKFTKNTSLNNILNETANSQTGEFDAWPEVSPQALRSKFEGTQGNHQMTDINNRPVDVNKLEQGLGKALTRDYSELVKRFK